MGVALKCQRLQHSTGDVRWELSTRGLVAAREGAVELLEIMMEGLSSFHSPTFLIPEPLILSAASPPKASMFSCTQPGRPQSLQSLASVVSFVGPQRRDLEFSGLGEKEWQNRCFELDG